MKSMEGTFILGNNETLKNFSGTYRTIPDLKNEIEIHNWIVKLFNENNIEKIVIEIGKEPILSLQIGYHIRLSIESLNKRVLIPIFYVSNLSLNSILFKTGIYSQILSTKGVHFSEFDLKSNILELEFIEGVNESEYLTKFLKIIQVQPDESFGRHSLANLWGAYILDKVSGVNSLSSEASFKKNLFFKYIAAFGNIDKLDSKEESDVFKTRGKFKSNIKILGNINKPKRVLLIDDESDKGWGVVLKEVLKSKIQELVIINEKVKDFGSLSLKSKEVIENEDFDLFLVDLRLNGLDEDENLASECFSGMKILKKIKSLNEGNQVIIFSASNKVWNLKALIDAGADGYYMKESPEYSFSKEISKQNYNDFINSVDKCLERDYLRVIFEEIKNAKNNKSFPDNHFISESNTALEIAWNLIYSGLLDFGYLTLFQSVESIANKLYKTDEFYDRLEGETVIDKSARDIDKWFMIYNKVGKYFSSGEEIKTKDLKPTTLFKLSCLFKFKYFKDDKSLKEIGKLNNLRNDIAHNGDQGFVQTDDLVKILKLLGEIRNS